MPIASSQLTNVAIPTSLDVVASLCWDLQKCLISLLTAVVAPFYSEVRLHVIQSLQTRCSCRTIMIQLWVFSNSFPGSPGQVHVSPAVSCNRVFDEIKSVTGVDIDLSP